MEIHELATVWTRTAGLEALQINNQDTLERATRLLEKSAREFLSIGEEKEAFNDLFMVYSTIYSWKQPESSDHLDEIMSQLEEIARITKDEEVQATMAVVRELQRGKYIAALLALQEREDDLLSRRDKLRELIKLGDSKERAK